jgi:hypothetical protein
MPELPTPVGAEHTPRGVARYYVLQVHSLRDGEPGRVSVTSGPFVEFLNAWYSAGAIHRIYPDRIFIAGEMCSAA